VVADRGMISQDTIIELESRQWPYILGARMRNQKEVREEVSPEVVVTTVVPLRPSEGKRSTRGWAALYCVF